MDDQSPAMEMPKYRCHKEVWALQIDDSVLEITSDQGAVLHFIDKRYAPIKVPATVISRYLPKPLDYLVVYSDGYQSISPRAAFEDGYTRI